MASGVAALENAPRAERSDLRFASAARALVAVCGIWLVAYEAYVLFGPGSRPLPFGRGSLIDASGADGC